MILALQTTTFSAHGGIPTYNRLVCRVLNDFATVKQKRLLAVTDSPEDLLAQQDRLRHLEMKAFDGKRGAFVLDVLRLALTQNVKLALIGHVNYAPLGLLLRRLNPSLRYGVMVHGVDVWSPLPLNRRRALQQADFVISVSEYTKQRVESVHRVAKNRIHLLPNALEWNVEPEADEFEGCAVVGKTINLLSVCRLEESEQYKGVDTVINALPKVVSTGLDVIYSVIGSGNGLERYQRLAVEQGVTERVHFLGSVDVETLRAHYRNCDIFIMPSAGEGFGIVFLEAMSYAKPIIAAESGAIPEVVQDGKTGLLVEYGNEEQVTEAIVRLAFDTALRKSFGRAGYRRLKENFTFTHFQRRLTEILNRELSVEDLEGEKTRVTVGSVANSV